MSYGRECQASNILHIHKTSVIEKQMLRMIDVWSYNVKQDQKRRLLKIGLGDYSKQCRVECKKKKDLEKLIQYLFVDHLKTKLNLNNNMHSSR